MSAVLSVGAVSSKDPWCFVAPTGAGSAPQHPHSSMAGGSAEHSTLARLGSSTTEHVPAAPFVKVLPILCPTAQVSGRLLPSIPVLLTEGKAGLLCGQ